MVRYLITVFLTTERAEQKAWTFEILLSVIMVEILTKIGEETCPIPSDQYCLHMSRDVRCVT